MKKKDKFDSVKNMRQIRDQLSRKFKDLSYQQEKQCIRQMLEQKKKEAN